MPETSPPQREGFTTGSAAAAAAKAGVVFLRRGLVAAEVEIPTPRAGRLRIPVESVVPEGAGARATVRKDAGDDPDVTDKAAIQCLVSLTPGAPEVSIEGGRGVGRVTRPGLALAVGEAAINPFPRQQIAQAVREALDGEEAKGSLAVRVLIEVPEGERLAQKTLNPRLGILGGISILGTRGTVKPFSHEAYQATIDQCLDMARAAGCESVGFATGGRSERLLRQALPEWPEQAFVPVADFFAHAMQGAGRRGFTRVVWGLFFGKLVKQAQGHAVTHAHKAALNFPALAALCRDLGLPEIAAAALRANTALEVQQLLAAAEGCGAAVYAALIRAAAGHARALAQSPLRVDYILFDFDGRVLARGEEGPWP